MRVTMSNFVKIGQMVVEILRLYGFPKWRPPPSWILKKFKFLTPSTFERPNLHYCAKFHQDRKIRC